VVIVALYCVVGASPTAGTNIALLPLATTVPEIGAPPVGPKMKLVGLSDDFFIVSENVADTAEFNATEVSAFAGEVDETAGEAV
jgi:hypothetical protein